MKMKMTTTTMLMIVTCTSDKTCATQDQLVSGRSASAQMGPEQESEQKDMDGALGQVHGDSD